MFIINKITRNTLHTQRNLFSRDMSLFSLMALRPLHGANRRVVWTC
jgi:hypothetical protein